MKIGLAIYNFNPKKGGAERYAFDLSVMLSKMGHEVFVICKNGVEIKGVKLLKLNTIGYPRWLRTLAFAINHSKCVRMLPLDVVLGFGNTFILDVYQSHGGVQKIWMEREIESYDDPGEKRLKAFLLKTSIHQRIQEWIAEYPVRKKRFSRIVAISDMVKNHMINHYKLPEGSIDVVYNGVDTARFRPADTRPSGRTRILFSGGNFRLKGLSPLIHAVSRLASEKEVFELCIMGRGRKERYRKMIHELGIDGYVRFLGETSTPEEVYRESHILAHPTFYDACSLTTMEAMAAGLPTITTRWNGASALISEEDGFVLDEPRDIEGLYNAIKGLLDKEKSAYLGKNASKKLQSFTIEKNVSQMEKIFFEVRDAKH